MDSEGGASELKSVCVSNSKEIDDRSIVSLTYTGRKHLITPDVTTGKSIQCAYLTSLRFSSCLILW